MPSMTPKADQIAQCVLDQFSRLPSRRKPTLRSNGLQEWVPLSGIVIETRKDGSLECVALATGMKCLPSNKIPTAHGTVLHDWHAEILAVRTFNRYLLDECQGLLNGGTSDVVERTTEVSKMEAASRPKQPFRIKNGLNICMYCSKAPCGDASMELVMASQEDATPWDTSISTPQTEDTLSGREFFSQLGIIRRKPARRDAPPTLSKSCSDKLSLKQCTSLLSSLSSIFIAPGNAYIHTLVVPTSQYTQSGFDRAFSAKGRMSALENMTWSDQHSFIPFAVETTDLDFEYSKSTVLAKTEKISACNVATAWSSSGVEESIVGGVIQGSKTSDKRGASSMARRRLWASARTLASQLDEPYADLQKALSSSEYGAIKQSELLTERMLVITDTREKALKGWVKNQGDSSFTID